MGNILFSSYYLSNSNIKNFFINSVKHTKINNENDEYNGHIFKQNNSATINDKPMVNNEHDVLLGMVNVS